jgi:Rod binding domain-containing protein
MDPVAPRSAPAAPQNAPNPQNLTPVQKAALQKLHQAATQLEGVFLQMVLSAMQETVPKDTIFGQASSSEQTWQSMLTDERAQAMAQSGSFGIAKALEQQLQSQVLADPRQEANTEVQGRMTP